jgi:hypothetical protein
MIICDDLFFNPFILFILRSCKDNDTIDPSETREMI